MCLPYTLGKGKVGMGDKDVNFKCLLLVIFGSNTFLDVLWLSISIGIWTAEVGLRSEVNLMTEVDLLLNSNIPSSI